MEDGPSYHTGRRSTYVPDNARPIAPEGDRAIPTADGGAFPCTSTR